MPADWILIFTGGAVKFFVFGPLLPTEVQGLSPGTPKELFFVETGLMIMNPYPLKSRIFGSGLEFDSYRRCGLIFLFSNLYPLKCKIFSALKDPQ